jgi:hypothetical protein
MPTENENLRAQNEALLEALKYCERQLEYLAAKYWPDSTKELRTYTSARNARNVIAAIKAEQSKEASNAKA